MKPNKNSRICVIGAGSAGLSAAYFLKKRGYQNVTVLEKAGKVGGKCNSITYGGKSFDLGANYITSSYKQVMKLAKEMKAEMFTESSISAFDPQNNTFLSLLKAVSAESSIWAIFFQSIKFVFKRWKLYSIMPPDKAGFKNISQYPELCQTFDKWLDSEGLSDLKTMFKIPISLMGYSDLNEIPTAYALSYMKIGTFMNLSLAAINPHIMGYPKRFKEGYQRFLEKISWQLDVIYDAEILKINREYNLISIDFKQHEQHLDKISSSSHHAIFDYLIVATPLDSVNLLGLFEDWSETEKALFSKIFYDPYTVTTYRSKQLEKLSAVNFTLPEPQFGEPYVVTKQFADNDLVSFYTRSKYSQAVPKEQILKNNEVYAQKMGGKLEGEYYTYDEWAYFPHVSSQNLAEGFYEQFEQLQGKRNTFYTGGLLAFELVENIINYSKNLVETHFPKN